jgi:hypothetical protein
MARRCMESFYAMRCINELGGGTNMRTIFLFITLSSVIASAQAENPSVVLSGRVIDFCVGLARDQAVTLFAAGSQKEIASTKTDVDGEFTFRVTASGPYVVGVTPRQGKVVREPVYVSLDQKEAQMRDILLETACPDGDRPVRVRRSAIGQSLEHEVTYGDDFGGKSKSLMVGLCELARRPLAFAGSVLSVRGTVQVGFEWFVLDTSPCTDRKLDYVWLEYGRGPKRQPTTWCCGDIHPQQGPGVVQNREFRKFDRYLRVRSGRGQTKSASATVRGFFEAVTAPSCEGSERCCPPGGFGHLGIACARLIIESLEQVVTPAR